MDKTDTFLVTYFSIIALFAAGVIGYFVAEQQIHNEAILTKNAHYDVVKGKAIFKWNNID